MYRDSSERVLQKIDVLTIQLNWKIKSCCYFKDGVRGRKVKKKIDANIVCFVTLMNFLYIGV